MNLKVILFLIAVVVLILCVTGFKNKNKGMQKLIKISVPLVLLIALVLCMSKTVEPYCDIKGERSMDNLQRVRNIMTRPNDDPAKVALIASMKTAAAANPLSPENTGGNIGYNPSELQINAQSVDQNPPIFSATGSNHSIERDSSCEVQWTDSSTSDLSTYYDRSGPGGRDAVPGGNSPNAPNIKEMCNIGPTFDDQFSKITNWPDGTQPGWWGEWKSNDETTFGDVDEWSDQLETICTICENAGSCSEFESRIAAALAAADSVDLGTRVQLSTDDIGPRADFLFDGQAIALLDVIDSDNNQTLSQSEIDSAPPPLIANIQLDICNSDPTCTNPTDVVITDLSGWNSPTAAVATGGAGGGGAGGTVTASGTVASGGTCTPDSDCSEAGETCNNEGMFGFMCGTNPNAPQTTTGSCVPVDNQDPNAVRSCPNYSQSTCLRVSALCMWDPTATAPTVSTSASGGAGSGGAGSCQAQYRINATGALQQPTCDIYTNRQNDREVGCTEQPGCDWSNCTQNALPTVSNGAWSIDASDSNKAILTCNASYHIWPPDAANRGQDILDCDNSQWEQYAASGSATCRSDGG